MGWAGDVIGGDRGYGRKPKGNRHGIGPSSDHRATLYPIHPMRADTCFSCFSPGIWEFHDGNTVSARPRTRQFRGGRIGYLCFVLRRSNPCAGFVKRRSILQPTAFRRHLDWIRIAEDVVQERACQTADVAAMGSGSQRVAAPGGWRFLDSHVREHGGPGVLACAEGC